MAPKPKNNESAPDDNYEVVMEEETGTSGCEAKIKKLKSQIATLKEEKQEYLLGWQSARADLVNTKKRLEAEHQERRGWANAKLLEDLLPVADSFRMAMANKDVWESVDENWRKGIEYISTQMQKVFFEYGLEEIEAVGQEFDPKLHDAVEERATEEETLDGTVAEVRQAGYKLSGRVLRPAKVVLYHIASNQ